MKWGENVSSELTLQQTNRVRFELDSQRETSFYTGIPCLIDPQPVGPPNIPPPWVNLGGIVFRDVVNTIRIRFGHQR